MMRQTIFLPATPVLCNSFRFIMVQINGMPVRIGIPFPLEGR